MQLSHLNSFFKKSTLLLIALFAIVSIGCSRASDEGTPTSSTDPSVGPAHISVTQTVKLTNPSGNAYVLATVENDGQGNTAFNVNVTVTAMRLGAQVDQASGAFIDLSPADIKKDGNAAFQAVFSNLSNHTEYDSLKYTFSWREEIEDTETSTLTLVE